ncbi:MAG: MOSC domain-containing protein, partial [Abitibacteriaceae bacterium]|nr:MOSC domain-containing protein [Abditibacteriaceae bacterium]
RVPNARITVNGVVGDKQRDLRYHGGPLRAVCLFSYEQIQALRAEGHPIEPGTTGENLTVSGLDWPNLHKGDLLRIGDEVQLEITSYAAPCHNIRGSFQDGEFKRMSQKLHPGWSRIYTRVLQEGTVREGDVVEWKSGTVKQSEEVR